MPTGETATLRKQVLRRLRSGEKVAAVAAECGVSRSTVYRWKRENQAAATKPPAARRAPRMGAAAATTEGPVGYLGDITGPGITDQWGVTGTDLGVCAVAPTASWCRCSGTPSPAPTVGQGDWRAPVALIGTGDTNNPIQYENAGGANPGYAQQLWSYVHDSAPWNQRRDQHRHSSDVLVIGQTMYLHAIVNRSFGNVIWTGIWASTDNGVTWQEMGPRSDVSRFVVQRLRAAVGRGITTLTTVGCTSSPLGSSATRASSCGACARPISAT